MKGKKERRDGDEGPEGLTHRPFAALRPAGEPAPAPAPAREPVPEPAGTSPSPVPGRVVLRREKKGRAGKTVTRVAGLGLDDRALDALARDMKRALGCGASTEAGDLVLHGSLTDRAAGWLRDRGWRDVSVGN